MKQILLKGTIKNVSFPRLLAYLNRNRETGTLFVTTPVFTKKVYLVKGDAVFASSTYEDDRLGEMLIKAEKITMEQYDESVRRLKKTGKRQGAILVELGYLTPKDLFWGVKYQVREIIYGLFLLEDAEYEFLRGEIPQHEVITLKMSMGNLIYEGVKRIDNWTRIRNELPGVNAVFKLSGDPVTLFQDVELGPLDRKMLSLIDGTKTIKELIDNAWTGSFEGMKILYGLWSLGVIEEKSAPEKAEQTVPLEEILKPVVEDARGLLKRVDEVYSELASISPHRLLELPEDADRAAIKKNYYRLTKEFHPDRYLESADPALKDKLTAIIDAFTGAYKMLTEKTLGANVGKKGKSVSQGEELFKKGVEAFRKKDLEEAVDYFRSATKADPKNPRYWSHLSLALSKTGRMLKEAESALAEAIRLEPDNSDHYANLGLIFAKKGMREKAHDLFMKSLELDPKNTKAKKGIEKTKG